MALHGFIVVQGHSSHPLDLLLVEVLRMERAELESSRSPSLTVEGLEYLKFEDVLQYVALPCPQAVDTRAILPKVLKTSIKPDGSGRKDMIAIFNFLRRKGVKRVVRIIVDDKVSPAHIDEAIERAVGGLNVEIWDWQKIDLCSETILTAAPDVREVCLYWSGNNAVLRGWSDRGGLAQLRKLRKVYLHVHQVILLLSLL